MKILFVCGAGVVYGKEIITLSLMEGLRLRGHEVRCVISSWTRDDFDRRLEAKSIPFTRLPLGFLSKTLTGAAMRMTFETLSQSPRLWRGYRGLLKEFQPDVTVHSTMHHLVQLYPVLDPRNTLFHVHDPFAPTRFYRRLFRFLNRRVRAFIGVSQYIEQSIIDLGVAREKACFVLNGLTPLLISNAVNDHPARKIVTIGIVGQISEWKGHDDFIEALKELKRTAVPFSAVIFGEGAGGYVAALKQKIEKYELSGQVRWAGFVKHPPEIFSTIDICVVPSRSQDPCPTVAIETAHFGVPAIATRRGGLPEIVRDGKTGYLVDAESPRQLAEKLKLLIENAGVRQRMSDEAKSYSARHLTGARMAGQMESVFLRTINHAASSLSRTGSE